MCRMPTNSSRVLWESRTIQIIEPICSTAGSPISITNETMPGFLTTSAPDRVIWGTDWPHPNVKAMPNDGDLVDLIPLFMPEPDLQKRILVDNLARLFEFDQ